MAENSQQVLKDLGFKTGYEELPSLQTVTEAELFQAREEAAPETKGFASSLGTAVQEEWIIPSIYENLDRFRSYDGEPVELTPEITESLSSGLLDKTAIKEVLQEAATVGMESALAVKETHLTTEKRRAELAAEGYTGTTATVLATMFDPAEWATIGVSAAAISALSGPAAPVTGGAVLTAGAAKRAKKAYSVGRAALAGAGVTAAELAAFESLRAKLKYDVDANDVLITAGLGAGLGGGINAATTAFVKRANVSRLAKIVAEGGELTPAQKAFYDANNVEATAQKLIDDTLKDETFIQSIDATSTARAIGDISAEEAAAIPKIAGAESKVMGWSINKLRDLVSVGYRTGSSKLNLARLGGAKLGMNSVGFVDGTTKTVDSASEIGERIQGQFRIPAAYTLHPNQRAWTKRTGGTIEEFNQLASRYARGIISDVDPEVKAVADLVKEQERKLAEMAIKNDVAGFTSEILDRHTSYLPRMFNDDRVIATYQKFGDKADDVFADLVEKAIRNAQPDIVADVTKSLQRKGRKKIAQKDIDNYIRRIAQGYAKTITDPKVGMAKGPAGSNEMNIQDFLDTFKDKFDEDELLDVMEILTRTGKDISKTHKRARPRMILDEKASILATRADGEVEEIHFYDLLEEDIEQLHNSYIFQMSGAIGLARNGIDTNQAKSSWGTFKENILQEAKKKGIDPTKEIQALDFMYDGITGRLAQREEVSNAWREGFIAARAYSFSVNMGMSGMSALMELSNAVFEYSVSTLLRTMPAYRGLYAKASKGRLDDDLMRELVEGLGIGGEVILGRFNKTTRYEGGNVEGYIGPEQSGWSKRAIKAQQFVSYWSGLNGVTQTLRRMSMLHFSTQFARAAKKGGKVFSDVKLRQLGLDDADVNDIKNAINEYSDFKGSVLKKLNLKDWPEPVREKFQAAGFKEARQSVQEMNIASTNSKLRSEVGKTFFQFLSFPLASLEQQAVRLGVRASQGDLAVAKVIVASALMGSLMYMTRVQLNAAGRGDADEYIQERMSPANFAEGALSQIGAASLFGYIYQLTTGAMDGNTYAMTPPAVSIAQSMFQVTKAYNDGEITEAEYRRMLRLLPAQSLYGARQLINYTANELGN
tara:strand:+ start:23372 stop:26695 length:3324 start_codon:yes stop_codon:yes gene_type:complete